MHSGLLINRDEQKIVIRNAKAEDTILNANDIEELQPQAISLMPEKQLNDLSDADIADLLEFLSQQKSLPTQSSFTTYPPGRRGRGSQRR